MVQRRDGRTLETHELGEPGGFAVIAHHGTPGSGLPYERWEVRDWLLAHS